MVAVAIILALSFNLIGFPPFVQREEKIAPCCLTSSGAYAMLVPEVREDPQTARSIEGWHDIRSKS